MSQISLVSKLVRFLVFIIAALHFSVYLAVIFFGDIQGAGRQASIQFGFISSHFSVEFNHSWQSIALALEGEKFNSAAILGSAELIPYAFIYFFVYRLFGLYQKGIVFTSANIRCLKYIGATLLGWILLNLLYPLLVTLVVRYSGASETVKFYLNFGTQELTYLLLGLVIYVIAWIMKQAIELKQDQELVI